MFAISLFPQTSTDPNSPLTTPQPGKKPGNVLEEWQRENKLPAADRKLFDFLNQEGHDLSDDQRNAGAPGVGRDPVVEEMRRRSAMDPKQREQLEFLESAKHHLDDIDRKALNSRVIDGSSFFEREKYLSSLTPDQRALLDKVQNENSLRPGGVYPFNQKHENNAPFSLDRHQDIYGGNAPDGDLQLQNSLRQFAVRSGSGF